MERASELSIDGTSWLALDRREGETRRACLERTLREAIAAGALRAGSALPSSRALAAQLGLSRGVVVEAYAQLAAQGFLLVRPRAVPVVAAVAPARPAPAGGASVAQTPRHDLTATTPDVTLFPRGRWLAALQHALRSAPDRALDYGDARGEPALREALADHLGRTRGVVADPGRIVVVQGTAQGVDLLLRVLGDRGARAVGVEDPSLDSQHARVRALGLDLLGWPVDEAGLLPPPAPADAVVVTPAHQFPTGAVLSGERRRALLAWAEACGALVIEDDYDAEFRYDREGVRALQGLDPDRVAYLGTTSKTLAPGLRLGWLVVPDRLVDAAVRTKRLLDVGSPALDQLALARLLRSGDLDRHVRRARSAYRARRDALLRALARELPDCPVSGIAAGLHVVLGLPAGLDDARVAAAALERGVLVAPLSRYRIASSADGALVVGFGRCHEDAVAPAVRLVAAAIRSSQTAASPAP